MEFLFLLCIIFCVRSVKPYQCEKNEDSVELYYPEKKEIFVFKIVCTNVTSETVFDYNYQNEEDPQDLYIEDDSNIPVLHSNFSISRFAGIRKLSLRSVNIQEIHPGVFDSFETLEELDLRDNNLRRISNGTFNNLKNLKILQLSDNSIEVIEKDSFSNLLNLHTLEMSYNHLNKIYNNTFNSMKNLKALVLFRNAIEIIEEDSFSGLFHLEYLEINYNKIIELHHNLFRDLTALVALDISHNNIKELPNQIFAHLTNLTHLSVMSNHLTTVDFANFPKLEKFYLSFNNINLTRNWEKLNAETFFISRNSIDEFEIPENVVALSLSHNKITKIINKFSTESEPIIENLDLSSNEITEIDSNSFRKLKNLTALNLGFNQIKIIPENAFQDCEMLSELNLLFNKIDRIEANAFKGINSVATIDVSRNNLNFLKSDLFGNIKTITLRLDQNVNCSDVQTLVSNSTIKIIYL